MCWGGSYECVGVVAVGGSYACVVLMVLAKANIFSGADPVPVFIIKPAA